MSIKNPLAGQPRSGNEFATLGGGCFWCLEAVYEELEGVVDVESGYSGGSVVNPSYRAVCDGNTGHAEVVRIEFDPAKISYREILEVFFVIHDPTTLNRQGNDVGTQYRSVIFTHSDEQKATAEAYHQRYFERNPNQGYCQFVIAPKVAKFRQKYVAQLKR